MLGHQFSYIYIYNIKGHLRKMAHGKAPNFTFVPVPFETSFRPGYFILSAVHQGPGPPPSTMSHHFIAKFWFFPHTTEPHLDRISLRNASFPRLFHFHPKKNAYSFLFFSSVRTKGCTMCLPPVAYKIGMPGASVEERKFPAGRRYPARR